MRFAKGLLPLGKFVYDARPEPSSTEFTLVDGFYSIGHIQLSRKYLIKKLKRFYRDLEYSGFYYALIKRGANPHDLQKRVVSGHAKLYFLEDMLEKALWSNKHLIWFESNKEHANFRVRSLSLYQDTMAVIKRSMGCLD